MYGGDMKKSFAEFLGTFFLAVSVVGSGSMAQLLTQDLAVQLLINASATGAVLWLIINLFGPISGAHFNPLVSANNWRNKNLTLKEFIVFSSAQVVGSISGVFFANFIFDRNVVEISQSGRGGINLFVSEIFATAGLIFLIFHLINIGKDSFIAPAVALWIFAAYFFTSSTSFANPAITVGRMFTQSFAGIAPHSVVPFIAAQIIGACVGVGLTRLLKNEK